ncbi:MAG: nucleotidyltransferase domain-containing protein [Bacteroidales bacterium]|nr:nucleotidyltransferase domain-containing protein [Bacteroidales bacterium]
MDKEEVINKVKVYSDLLRKYFPVEKVYLYGSYAKDNNHEDSDIDVAVVVRKIEGDYFSVEPLLWRLRRQVDDRIEPILIEQQNDTAGFLEEIERNGIEVV